MPPRPRAPLPQEDRPLLVQFCANDPATLLAAAQLVQDRCDGVDLNLGCPQRIAKRGNYGAFLMDDLQTVRNLVATLAAPGALRVPVTCKIRLFPELDRTIAYAKMLEEAGCSLLAVHGRTREQKHAAAHRADWAAIAAVRAAVRIPVLANGDVRDLDEAAACMAATGAVGVLSAEPLLWNPALFDGAAPRGADAAAAARPLAWPALLGVEYCELAERYPTPFRMVRGHVHKLLGGWLTEFTDLRDELNAPPHTLASARAVCAAAAARLAAIEAAEGRRAPVAKKSERALAREAAEAAKAEAVAEQERERAALAALGGGCEGGGCEGGGCEAQPPAEAGAEEAEEAARKRARVDAAAPPLTAAS
jgi:tRNA-dihydrouridine synthase 1